jgi:hypothetical protein
MEDKQTTDTLAPNYASAPKSALRLQVESLPPQLTGNTFKELFIGSPGTGREVDPAMADACIKRYAYEMRRRYVLAPGDPLPSGPTTDVLQVTHFVNFTGRDLMYWILEQCFRPEQQDAVDFKLANGIYTEEFLEFYFPGNETEKAIRRNRITIFIIPFEKGTSKILPGGSAYDLGGLEP